MAVTSKKNQFCTNFGQNDLVQRMQIPLSLVFNNIKQFAQNRDLYGSAGISS